MRVMYGEMNAFTVIPSIAFQTWSRVFVPALLSRSTLTGSDENSLYRHNFKIFPTRDFRIAHFPTRQLRSSLYTCFGDPLISAHEVFLRVRLTTTTTVSSTIPIRRTSVLAMPRKFRE